MSPDLEQEKAELLRIHAQDRHAHMTGDVDLLFEHGGEEFISVNAGRVSRSMLAEGIAHFRPYMAASHYYEWDDIEPPIVHISDDATMAWMITRQKIQRGAVDSEGEARIYSGTYAGIMTYAKQGDRWKRVANVTTWGEYPTEQQP